MENLKVIALNADFEELRNIEGFEGLYQVSNQGRVYSVKRGKFKKPFKNNKNYLQVELWKDGKYKKYYVHRLVASAFLENPLHLPIINHKDENPLNNCVENLEWCSCQYNNTYGRRLQKMMQNPNWKASHKKIVEKLSKQVLQFTKDGKFVKEYSSTKTASKETKINQGNISQCCRGKLHSAGGFIWRYKEEVA